MKKYLLILAAALMAAVPAGAQKKTTYTFSCDGVEKTITWTVTTRQDKSIEWHLVSGDDAEEYYSINPAGETLKWRRVCKGQDTDLTITRSNNVYSYSGKFKGKEMNKTVKSKGHPWFQNIELNVMDHLKGEEDFEYECIRPTEADLHVMQATNKGIVQVEGFSAYHVRSTVGGMFAGIWGCDYYYDSKTKEFVVYKAIEGGPGTPETKIVRKK